MKWYHEQEIARLFDDLKSGLGWQQQFLLDEILKELNLIGELRCEIENLEYEVEELEGRVDCYCECCCE